MPGEQTIRMKKLKKKLSEKIKANLRNAKDGKKARIIMTKALRECGYSESYANTSQVKKTKHFHELMEQYLPEDKVVRTHSDLMGASEIQHYIFPGKGRGRKKKLLEDDEIKKIIESVPGCKLIYIKTTDFYEKIGFFQAPDNRSRKAAIDMAYNLRGRYAPQAIEITRPFKDLSDEELAQLIKEEKDKLNKK